MTGRPLPKFDDVLYQIYQATLSLDRWPAALDCVAGLCGSAGALVYAKVETRWIIPMHSPALEEAARRYRQDDWQRRNPWLEAGVEAGFRVGDVYRDQDVFTPEKIEDGSFYRDFLAPLGLGWQMAAILQSDFGVPTGVVTQRAHDQGLYDPDEAETLRLVSRHIEQALRISAHLDAADGSQGAVARAFDVMAPGAFVLDQGQRPVAVNRAGKDLVGRYFHPDGATLKPVRARDHAPFAAMIGQAARLDAAEAPRPVLLSDGDGRSRVAAWAMPLVGASADRFGIARPQAHTLVLAQPLERARVIDPGVLRSVFGLTLAEARLAALLGAGSTVKAAAQTLGVTEGTARVVLKRVFDKLDVNRQADLVARLAVFARPGPALDQPAEEGAS